MDFVERILHLAGVAAEDSALLAPLLTRQLARERSDDDKALLFESWIALAIPCDVEDPGIEVEDPWPESSSAQLALHWAGLFANDLLATMVGGALGDRLFLADTNAVRSAGTLPLYVAETQRQRSGERLITRFVPHVYVPSSSMSDAAREAWSAISALGVEEETPQVAARRAELGRSFVREYPGIAHVEQSFLLRALGADVLASAPAPQRVSEELLAPYESLLELAPSFLEAKGLPALGASATAAERARSRLRSVSSFGAYEAPHLLAELFIAWLGGDEAVARSSAEAILSGKLGVPLTRRWAARVLGQEPQT